jgi:putative LysE/RhtB family amino acid efflux pump
MHAATVGFGLGFVVALQLGPMSLFLIRSTLRSGWRVGLAVGLGIAAIDGLYAACGVAGAAPLLRLSSLRTMLGIAGALVLLWLGFKTLRGALLLRAGLEASGEACSPVRAFGLAVAGTASNPATIISWAALFTAAHSVASVDGTLDAGLLIAGVLAGSLTWVSLLATVTAAARRLVGQRALRAADCIAGSALVGFGGALAYTATREH